MREYWKLTIATGNQQLIVCGAEENLRLAYDEARAAMADVSGAGPKYVEVHGHSETPDAAPVSGFVASDAIEMAVLAKTI